MTGAYLTNDGGLHYEQLNFDNGAYSFAYDPHNPASIWVGSSTLNRSLNGGKTWIQVFPSPKEVQAATYSGDHASYQITPAQESLYNTDVDHIGTIRVDPSLAGVVYFSMGAEFYYTLNDGQTWDRERLDQPIEYIYSNNTSLKNEVIILTRDFRYRFDKTSRSISKADLPVSMSPAFSFCAGIQKDNATVFYALHHDQSEEISGEFGHTELWSSTDDAKTWRRVDHSLISNAGASRPSYSMVMCAEFDASQVYVVCNRYEEEKVDQVVHWYGALKSGDGGSTWAWVWKGGGGSGQYGVKDGHGVSNLNDAWVEKAFGGEYIRLLDVGVNPQDGNIAIVTDWYRTMKTTDGGRTWNEIYSVAQPDGTFVSRGLDVTTAYNLHFDPFDASHMVISYTDIGYHHSFNGGRSWQRSVQGVPGEWVNTCYDVVFDPEVRGKIWSAWSGLHDFPRGKMTRNPSWREYARGGICVSTDGGMTWIPASEGMDQDSPATSVVLDHNSPPGNRTLYASVYNKGIFKSMDDGKSWTLKNKNIGPNTCAFELTLAANGNLFVVISPTPEHKEGIKGMGYYAGDVYRSTDGAETWTKLDITHGPLFPSGMEVDPENPDRLYLSCWAEIQLSDLVGGDVVREFGGNKTIDMAGGIFLSEDGGDSWRSIFDQKQYVYDVTIDPFHPGRLYCNTFNKAAYRSDDRGTTWKKIKGYNFHWGHRVIIDQNNNENVYLTTYGSSVWHGRPMAEID
jgi:hypothetical protein